MPHYYFNTSDGRPDIDDQGADLPDLAAARAMAARYAGDLLASEPQHLWEKGDWAVNVADEDHVHLFTLKMRQVEGSGETLPGPDAD